jgi:MoxR-like ATPase
MTRTIVFKHSSHLNSDSGTVTPIAEENDDGSVSRVIPGDYPNNNKIFISKDYTKIDEAFGDQELFFLREVTESPNFLTEDRDNPSKSKYYSMGYHSAPLETNTYIPILSMAMPDIASGKIEQKYSLDIGRKHFFIFNEGIVSGPFIAEQDDENETWIVTPTNIVSPLGLKPYHIAQFKFKELENSGLILRCSLGDSGRIFFTSLKKAKNEIEFETKDHISDSDLIRLFAKRDYGKDIGNLTKNEAKKLLDNIDTYSKKRQETTDDERNTRIKNILGDYLNSEDIGVNIVHEYLNTKEGKHFLENFINMNRDVFLKDTLSTFEKTHSHLKEKNQREIALLQTKLEEKRSELQQFEREMDKRKEKIRNEIEKLNADSKEQEKNSLRDRNKGLMKEIEDNEKKLEELKSKTGDYGDIHTRQEERKKIDMRITMLREDEHELRGLIATQKELIKSPDVSKKLVEFKTIQMLLNGISPEISELQINPVTLTKFGSELIGETRKSYIDSLKTALDSTPGRQYTYDETANLLLCTLQSYITVLAGPPGTGKTSTVNRFADALGLISKEKTPIETDNFLSIPIGRGWMSSRDILGFYNSLKNTYQPSRSGLYQFIKAFSDKINNTENIDYLKLVLMDEANLSSIEHYWSDFLLMCDSFEENHKIDLGISSKANRYLHIPSSLRFICTINNDATVESLSNRLIDRAAIVSLGYGDKSSPAEIQNSILSGVVPYKELMNAFSPKNNEEELEDREKSRLHSILEHLSINTIKGTQINFSQRKINAITRYCYIANQMDYKKIEPMDFAISQHILPSISGHGQGFRERLERLNDKLEEFKYVISQKIVSDIVATGDDFSDSYSFF